MGEKDHRDLSGRAKASQGVTPEALLATVIDLTDDAVLTCDPGAAVAFFSSGAERLCGRSSLDMTGAPVTVLFAPHLHDEVAAVLARVAAGERIRHFETEIVRSDGLPVPVSLSLAPLVTDIGGSAGSVLVARDVTEQHLAQATLAEIDARLEEAEALSHIGSWLWDLRTGAVQWSSEFHRAHGIDPLDFAGTFADYIDLIHEDDRDAVRLAMTESVEQSRALDIEYRVRHPDQKEHLIRLHADPTQGSDGKSVGLRGIGHDITDEVDSKTTGDPRT